MFCPHQSAHCVWTRGAHLRTARRRLDRVRAQVDAGRVVLLVDGADAGNAALSSRVAVGQSGVARGG